MTVPGGRRAIRHRRADSRPAGANAPESGETLLELIVTTVLLSLAIVALLSGLLTAIRASVIHRDKVSSANEAVDVVETVERATYVPCGSDPTAAYTTAAAGMASAVGNLSATVEVAYLADRAASTASFVPGCPATDQGAQQVTIKVTGGDEAKPKTTVVLVKRDDRCPTDPATVATLAIAPGDRC